MLLKVKKIKIKKTRKIKLEKTDIFAFVMVFLIFMYSFTKSGIHDYIYPISAVCYLSFGFIIAAAIRTRRVLTLKGCTVLDVLILLCLFVLIFNRNYNFSNGEYEDGISFIVIVLFYLLVRNKDSWHKFILPVMGIWIALHTIVTLMEYAVPGFYMNQIFPLMPAYAHVHLNAVFRSGYIPGLAVHYSTNGMYLSVSFIVIGTLLLFSEKKNRITRMFILCVVAAALLLTGKRALILFPALAFAVMYYLYNSNKPISRVGKQILLALTAAAVFSIGCVFVPALSNFILRFIETSEAGDVFLGRLEQADLALHVFLHNWFLGCGWDSFQYFYQSRYGALVKVHNIYLQLLCENGILGSIPFFLFFIIAVYRSIQSFVYLRKYYPGKYSTDEFYLGLSIAMQCFFLLYGMTGNPLYDQQVFYPYMVCVTAGEFYVNRVTELRKHV